MSNLSTPQKVERGWVINIPSEIAQALSVPEGSIALLHARSGKLEIEILPPLSPQIAGLVRETYEESKEVFEELKRLGD